MHFEIYEFDIAHRVLLAFNIKLIINFCENKKVCFKVKIYPVVLKFLFSRIFVFTVTIKFSMVSHYKKIKINYILQSKSLL